MAILIHTRKARLATSAEILDGLSQATTDALSFDVSRATPPAIVDENDRRALLVGFFLILGHSLLAHVWIFTSTRSAAYLAGF